MEQELANTPDALQLHKSSLKFPNGSIIFIFANKKCGKSTLIKNILDSNGWQKFHVIGDKIPRWVNRDNFSNTYNPSLFERIFTDQSKPKAQNFTLVIDNIDALNKLGILRDAFLRKIMSDTIQLNINIIVDAVTPLQVSPEFQQHLNYIIIGKLPTKYVNTLFTYCDQIATTKENLKTLISECASAPFDFLIMEKTPDDTKPENVAYWYHTEPETTENNHVADNALLDIESQIQAAEEDIEQFVRESQKEAKHLKNTVSIKPSARKTSRKDRITTKKSIEPKPKVPDVHEPLESIRQESAKPIMSEQRNEQINESELSIPTSVLNQPLIEEPVVTKSLLVPPASTLLSEKRRRRKPNLIDTLPTEETELPAEKPAEKQEFRISRKEPVVGKDRDIDMPSWLSPQYNKTDKSERQYNPYSSYRSRLLPLRSRKPPQIRDPQPEPPIAPVVTKPDDGDVSIVVDDNTSFFGF